MNRPRAAMEHPGESFCFSPDSSKLACINEEEVHVIDLTSGDVRVFVDRLLETTGQRSIAWSPNGKFIATSFYPDQEKKEPNSRIHLWDAETGRQLHGRKIELGHAGWTSVLDWSSDGNRLLYHGNPTRIIDVATGEILTEVKGKDGSMSAWNPDGTKGLSVIGDSLGPTGSQISIWNAATGKEDSCIDAMVFTAQWDPTGQYIVGACPDGVARIWDANTLKLVRELPGHSGWLTVVDWSPDGQRLATAGDLGLIKIWNPHTGQHLVTFDSTIHDIVGDLRWSPDSKKLAAKGFFSEKTIRIWDASAGYREADSPLKYDENAKPVGRLF